MSVKRELKINRKECKIFGPEKIKEDISSYLDWTCIYWLKNEMFLNAINKEEDVFICISEKENTLEFKNFKKNKSAINIKDINLKTIKEILSLLELLNIIEKSKNDYKINHKFFINNSKRDKNSWYKNLLEKILSRIDSIINLDDRNDFLSFTSRKNKKNHNVLYSFLLGLLNLFKKEELKEKFVNNDNYEYISKWTINNFNGFLYNENKEKLNYYWKEINKNLSFNFICYVLDNWKAKEKLLKNNVCYKQENKNDKEVNEVKSVDFGYSKLMPLKDYFITIMKHEYFIPYFQRSYEWTEELVLNLLNDLLDGVRNNKDQANSSEESNKYLSNFLFCSCNDENKIEIVDGQQRTITLILILFALYVSMLSRNVFDRTDNNEDKEICKILKEMFYDQKITKYFEKNTTVPSYNFLNEIFLLKDKQTFLNNIKSKKEGSFIFKLFELILISIENKRLDKNWDFSKFYFSACKAILEKTFITYSSIHSKTLKNFIDLNTKSKPLNLVDIWLSYYYDENCKNSKNLSKQKEFGLKMRKYFLEVDSKDEKKPKINIENYFYFLSFLHNFKSDGTIKMSEIEELFKKIKNDYVQDNLKIKIDKQKITFSKYLLKTVLIFVYINSLKLLKDELNDVKNESINYLETIIYKNLWTITTFSKVNKLPPCTFHSVIFTILNKFNVINHLVDASQSYSTKNEEKKYNALNSWLFKLELFYVIIKVFNRSDASIRKGIDDVANGIIKGDINDPNDFFDSLFQKTHIDKNIHNYEDFKEKLRDRIKEYKNVGKDKKKWRNFQNLYKNIIYRICTYFYSTDDELELDILSKIKEPKKIEFDHIVALNDEKYLSIKNNYFNYKNSIGNIAPIRKKDNRAFKNNTDKKIENLNSKKRNINNFFLHEKKLSINDKEFKLEKITIENNTDDDKLAKIIEGRENTIIDILETIYKY
ncbi:MAG: DUF262 domain-containing protein [Mycoplasma sp.]